MNIPKFIKWFLIFIPLFFIIHVIVELVFSSTMKEVMTNLTWKEIYGTVFKALIVAVIYSFSAKHDIKEKI
ncbi:MAG: hypothetical protein JST82_12135 [Bacteroidetes bacterium]|nr:hypothetical protein [Bacteroidota bacterium]